MDRHGLTGAVFSSMTLLVVCIALYFLWEEPLILAFVLLGISLVIVRGKIDTSIFLVMFFLTLIMEPIMVAAGVWEYGQPNFLGIPYWLPFLWGIVGVAVKDLVVAVEEWHG